ncbi:MAG: TetR/AcrR family transcriptional regulator [Aquabacterium sp.]
MNTVIATAPVTRSYKGASIEERRHQRRERLIDAALEAFARRGIAKTTIRDICSEARLTERYFYESFRGTEEAFDAVYLHLKCQLVARVTEALSHAPKSVEQLAAGGLRAFYVFLREDPRRAQILLIDAFSANQQSHEKSKKAVRDYIEMIGELAAMLYPTLVKKLDIEMLAGGLVGMAIQVGIIWARGDYKKPIEDVLGYNLYAWQGLQATLHDMERQAATRKKAAAPAKRKVA